MRNAVGSVFSGIGGFDEGFRRAGYEIAWMCEREPFCRSVLARRFPDVPCFEDVTTLTDAEPVDWLVGGFPCQDVSVAGQRRGLAGERTGLFWEFMRLIDVLQPKGVVLENVPGLFSSHRGRDFYTVLHALAERGLRRCYRVLDSQYFGVPQRRRRVFIVGRAGGFGDSAQAFLFEPESRSRDSAKSEQARARVAASLRGRFSRAGVNEPGRGGEDDQNLVIGGGSWPTFSKEMPTLTSRRADQTSVAYAVTDNMRNRSQGPVNYVVDGERARALTASMHKRHDADTDTLRPLKSGGNDRHDESHETYIAATLNSGGHDGGFRTEPGEHLVPTMLQWSHKGRDVWGTEYATALQAMGNMPGQGQAVAYALRSDPGGTGQGHNTTYPSGVRRLTPLECERLQGFPDGWTCLCGEGHRGSQYCSCPDTPRYKALGNAVTVPVAEWIARRLISGLGEATAQTEESR